MSGSGATVGETTAPLPVAQIVMDVYGTIVDFDAAAESLLGYSRDEALGRQASDLVIPGRLRPAHDAGLRRYREPGEAPLLDNRFELPALRRDGAEIMIDLVIPRRLRAAHDAGLRRYRETGEAPLLDNRFELPALRRDGTEIMIDLALSRTVHEGQPAFAGRLQLRN